MIFKSFMREHFMPLPVAFISTIGADGIRNIAPYSCIMPVLRPLDLICLASAHKRDTLKNIRDTREFVVNLPGTSLADKVIPTARHSPPEIDEFLMAGLLERPSIHVRAPGIEGCYAWMECELHKEYEESNYILIMGRVLRLEVADHVLTSEGTLDVDKAKPLMMVGGSNGMRYCTIADINKFESFGAMFPDGRDPLENMYQE
jgi:flavin reductase (DIM6/NTAB) family NADH-FMN oxidoreductase RutF